VLDARVLGVLGKRLARYGLTLHPDKTRFVDFRNTASNGMADPATDGTTFTFLGFTYIWGKSRAGKNVVRLVTPLAVRLLVITSSTAQNFETNAR
jgi:RNA-directed DNA polymerase